LLQGPINISRNTAKTNTGIYGPLSFRFKNEILQAS
jgi:hypothetical protein